MAFFKMWMHLHVEGKAACFSFGPFKTMLLIDVD